MLGLLAQAPPWTFWIAPVLVIATIGAIVSVIGGYLFFVTRKQFPSRKQRKLMQQQAQQEL